MQQKRAGKGRGGVGRMRRGIRGGWKNKVGIREGGEGLDKRRGIRERCMVKERREGKGGEGMGRN